MKFKIVAFGKLSSSKVYYNYENLVVGTFAINLLQHSNKLINH